MYNSIIKLILKFRTEDQCIQFLENLRWPEHVISPFDNDEICYKLKNNYYKGSKTKRVFNVRYGTIFHKSKIPLLVWFAAIGLFCSAKKGISSYQMARNLNISQKTSYYMLRKIRSILYSENDRFLRGVIQADEVFIGPKGDTRTSRIVKTPVLGLVDYHDNLVMKALRDTSKSCVYPILKKHIKKGSVLFTDEAKVYLDVKTLELTHYACNHDKKKFVIEKTGCTTNAIENLWKHFRTLIRNYNRVSSRWLQLYVDEYVFRFNNKKLDFRHLFCKAVSLAVG